MEYDHGQRSGASSGSESTSRYSHINPTLGFVMNSHLTPEFYPRNEDSLVAAAYEERVLREIHADCDLEDLSIHAVRF